MEDYFPLMLRGLVHSGGLLVESVVETLQCWLSILNFHIFILPMAPIEATTFYSHRPLTLATSVMQFSGPTFLLQGLPVDLATIARARAAPQRRRRRLQQAAAQQAAAPPDGAAAPESDQAAAAAPEPGQAGAAAPGPYQAGAAAPGPYQAGAAAPGPAQAGLPKLAQGVLGTIFPVQDMRQTTDDVSC